MNSLYLKTFIFAVLAGAACQSRAFAQPSLINHLMDIRQAVVSITAENINLVKTPIAGAALDPATGGIIIAQKLAAGSYSRTGAGVIIHPDGILITNAHTANKANLIKVTLDTGETIFAQPIALINDMDLLFLKIDAGRQLSFVRIANSDTAALGQDVFTIGHSAFLKDTITGGKIIGLGVNRTLKYSGIQRTDLIQTTINLYQGDSGGPLFNRDGELIGLMTADERSADHSSFAIPSNKIREYLIEYFNSNNSSPEALPAAEKE